MGGNSSTTRTRSRGRQVELQPRDYQVLVGLFESRLMTLKHAAVLYFKGKGEAAKKRVQKLKAAGFIRERARGARERSILHLSPLGLDVLREQGLLDRYPQLSAHKLHKRMRVGETTIAHELAVMDVKAAFVSAIAAARPRLELAEFSTWPALCRFRAYRPDGVSQIINPDAFIRIIEQVQSDSGTTSVQHFFFLEVDKSSEVQEILGVKAFCYRDYYRRGGFALRRGKRPEEFDKLPFRVLFVMRSTARIGNTARMLREMNPPINNMAWLSAIDDVNRNPLAAIWHTSKSLQGHHGVRSGGFRLFP